MGDDTENFDMREWLLERIRIISRDDYTRHTRLTEMKEFILTIPEDELPVAAQTLCLPTIFDCLNDSEQENVDLACEILTICLNNLELGEAAAKYVIYLQRALNHPFSSPKIMALNDIRRSIENDDVLIQLAKQPELINGLIYCLGDTDLEVVKKASEIMKVMCLNTVGAAKLVDPNRVKILKDVMSITDIVRFRILEVLVEISTQSDINFNLIKTTGIFGELLKDLDNKDILLRLNVLAILTTLASCKYGLEFFDYNRVFTKVLNMLDDDDSTAVQLSEPGILKFLGHIAFWQPSVTIENHRNFIERLFTNLDSPDYSIVGVSLDTIGHIGLSDDGKIAFDSTNEFFVNGLRKIAQCIPSLPTETKVRALHCIEYLLKVLKGNPSVYAITEKWFSLIDDNPIDLIWNYTKNPFAEIRLAGLGVFKSLSKQTWAQKLINDTPGLMEFILDRNVEHHKECKDAKYALIYWLSQSDYFNDATQKKLQNFVREGAFYVEAVPEVEIDWEGDD